jgi:hypothetical protein
VGRVEGGRNGWEIEKEREREGRKLVIKRTVEGARGEDVS